MQLVNDLENDLALAVLVKRNTEESIDSKEVLPLIHRIREVLEPISERDHAYSESEEESSATTPGI